MYMYTDSHLRSEGFHSLVQYLTGRVDLLLPSEEEEYVTRRLSEVYLHHCYEGRIKIVALRLLRV